LWYAITYFVSLAFRWIAVPFVQAKLDEYRQLRNTVTPRHHKHKILPHGPPMLIRSRPDFYKVLDFKVCYIFCFSTLYSCLCQVPAPPQLFDELEQLFAPPEHEVFQLVPALFDQWASKFYDEMGGPQVTDETFWPIFVALRQHFMSNNDAMMEVQPVFDDYPNSVQRIEAEHIELMAGLNEAPAPNELHPEMPELVEEEEVEEEEIETEGPGRRVYNLDRGGGQVYAAFSDDEEEEADE
jgi:hypothetical protein